MQITAISDKIKYPILLAECERRGVSVKVVQDYMKQCLVDKKPAFCYQNNSDGWEVMIPDPMNPVCHGHTIGKGDITVFPSRVQNADILILNNHDGTRTAAEFIKGRNKAALIFNDIWDLIAYRAMMIKDPDNTMPVVRAMFNDEALTHEMASACEEYGLALGDQSHLYDGHGSLSNKLISKVDKPNYRSTNTGLNGAKIKFQW